MSSSSQKFTFNVCVRVGVTEIENEFQNIKYFDPFWKEVINIFDILLCCLIYNIINIL